MIHKYYKYTKPDENNLKEIYLGMGCFWKKEALFWKVNGIVFTEVGYAECTVDKPSCADAFKVVNHKEVVKITYNPYIINLDNILSIFWNSHTIDKREDFPVPSLYQSMIYVDNKIDFYICDKSIDDLIIKRRNENNPYDITTEIKFINNYVVADETHQQYVLKNEYV